MSRRRVIERLPPAAVSVLTMMSSNSSDIVERAGHIDRELKVLPGGGRGCADLSGRDLLVLLADRVDDVPGVRERASSCCGLSQTRMLYWPIPKTVTSPTPDSRASTSRMRIEA